MRIDKYLWCVRHYKTRNMATEACRKNQVTVGGQPAKPSREVFPGDRIGFRKDQVVRTIVVLDIPTGRVGAKLADIYRKDETPPEVLEHLRTIRSAQQYYRQSGEGRPTKKDRRELDDFGNDQEIWDDDF